jgi:hypothetical protein
MPNPVCAVSFGARSRAADSTLQSLVVATAPHKEAEDMETIFHILGIVYYTVALIDLVATMLRKRQEKQSD